MMGGKKSDARMQRENGMLECRGKMCDEKRTEAEDGRYLSMPSSHLSFCSIPGFPFLIHPLLECRPVATS